MPAGTGPAGADRALPGDPTPDAATAPGVTVSQPAAPARVGSAAFERHLAEAAALGVMAIWGGNFIVVKSTIPILTPIGYAFARFLLAGLVLLVVTRIREGSVTIPRHDIVPLAALGAVGFGVYQMMWPTALQTTSVGNSALLIAATPIFTALIASAIGADSLGPGKMAGTTVAFVGVALVASSHGFVLDRAAIGDVLSLAAALSWAVYVSFGTPVLRRHSPLRTTAWTILFGTVVLAPVGIWQLAHADLSAVGPAQVGAILYSALLAGALGNVIIFWGIKLLGPTRITNLQFLPPALAIAMAAIFLGEPILASQVAGGVVIAAGVLLARRDRVVPRRLRRGLT